MDVTDASKHPDATLSSGMGSQHAGSGPYGTKSNAIESTTHQRHESTLTMLPCPPAKGARPSAAAVSTEANAPLIAAPSDANWFVRLTAYFSFTVYLVWGTLLDRVEACFRPRRKKSLLAPLVDGFEDFYRRRVYARLEDCFFRPIASCPGAYMDLMLQERVKPGWNLRSVLVHLQIQLHCSTNEIMHSTLCWNDCHDVD